MQTKITNRLWLIDCSLALIVCTAFYLLFPACLDLATDCLNCLQELMHECQYTEPLHAAL